MARSFDEALVEELSLCWPGGGEHLHFVEDNGICATLQLLQPTGAITPSMFTVGPDLLIGSRCIRHPVTVPAPDWLPYISTLLLANREAADATLHRAVTWIRATAQLEVGPRRLTTTQTRIIRAPDTLTLTQTLGGRVHRPR